MVQPEHPGVATRSYPLSCANASHHMLKYHPAGHPAAVAAQRVSGVKLPAVSADEGAELDPGRLQQR